MKNYKSEGFLIPVLSIIKLTLDHLDQSTRGPTGN